MKRFNYYMVFILLICVSLYAKKPAKSFIIARPVDAGAINETSKDIWTISLLDELVRFRLEPLKEIKVVPLPILKNSIPEISNPTVSLNSEIYFNAAKNFKTSFILTQKFELTNNKMIDYYLECISSDGDQLITSYELSFTLENMAVSIDSCLLSFLKQMDITLSPQTVNFFRIPLLSKDTKLIRQLGELISQENSSKTPDYSHYAREYEKLIEKDPFLLLANYAAGLSFFYSKDYNKSAKYLKELLDLTPLHTSLYLVLARSYRLAKRYNEAFDVSTQCEKMHLRSVPYLLEKAFALEGLNQTNMALSVHKRILSLNPKQPQSLQFLAKYKNDIAQYKKALVYAEKLVSVSPQNGYGYFEHGRCLFATGEYDQALKSLEKANSLNPNDRTILEWLGDLYMRKQVYSKASDAYQKSYNNSNKDLKLLLKTAKAFEFDSKVTDALKLLKENQKSFSDNPQIQKAIGLLELVNGDLEAAYTILESYLKSNPYDGDALWNMGSIYSRNSQPDQAIEMYSRALPLLENKIQCKLAIAEQHLKCKDYKNAKKFLEEIISEKPIINAHKFMGDAFTLAGDLRKALSHYDQERKLHGESIPLQEKIARISFELEDLFFPAKKEYENILKMSSDHTEAHYYLAIINLKEGNLKTAETHLKKASSLGKGDDKIYFNLGLFYSRNKLDSKAVQYYEKCIKYNDNHIPALKNLGELYSGIGSDSAAAETYIKLFTADNSHSSKLAQAGHIFRKLKLDDKAVETYDLFLKKGFSDFSVNAAYSSIKYENKEYNTVIKLLQGIKGKWVENEHVLLMFSDANCQTGHYKSALPWLKNLLSLNPENTKALKLSAVASEKTQDTLTAISMYERYLNLSQAKDRSEDAFHLGLLYEKSKMFKKAVSRYESNIKQYSEDIRNYEQLGSLYAQLEDWKSAERILRAGIKHSNAKPKLTKLLAFTLAKQNKLSESATFYTKYLELVKNDADAWKSLGKIYFSQRKHSAALKPLSKAVELLPKDFDCLYMSGASLVETSEFSKAVAPLGRARSIKSKNSTVIELLARCYRNLRETSTLTTLLKEWISIDPKRYDIKMELGALYLDEKDISEAIQMLTEAVRFIPSEAKPYLLLAKAYEIQGNDSLQYEHLLKALRFSPDNWEINYNLARYYRVKEIVEKAEQHLKIAMQQNPGNANIHFEYGYYLLNRSDYSQAAKEFNIALESEPNNPLYLALYAYAICMKGDITRSLEHITVASGKAPTDPRIKFWAGKVYLQANKTETARQLFNDALTINPSYADCYEALGDSYLKETKFKEASKYYFRSWEKGGYNQLRALKLGNSLAYDRKFTEAKDFYEAIVNKDPEFDEAIYKLVYTYCELGDLNKAQKTLELFKNNNRPWMQLAQSKIFETENNSEAALVALSIAKQLDSNNPYLQSAYGRIYLKTGEYESAIIALSTATAMDSLNMDIWVNLGKAFELNGDPSSAFQYYMEVDKRYPEHPDIHALMAKIKSRQKAHIAAIRVLERGIKYHPDNPNLFFLIGREYELADQYESALESYQTALKKGKGRPAEALRYMGNIYYDKLINSKKAKEFYKKYVKASDNPKYITEVKRKLEGI